MSILALYNIKGGVGKTASAVNLAYLSSLDGAHTLLWDLDPQAAATFYFRVKAKIKGGSERLLAKKSRLGQGIRATDFDHLDLLPADFSYRNMDLDLRDYRDPTQRLSKLLRPLEKEYDRIFLDCPPSISLVSENVFTAAQALLIPTIPTPLSLRTLGQLKKHIRHRGLRHLQLLPFLSMVDSRKSLHRQGWAELKASGETLLRPQIPYSTWVEQMGTQRSPLGVFAPSSPPALAYGRLWQAIKESLE
jgi:cellulose biosynthesis protein BcsQ